MQEVLLYPALRNEVYAQLIKQLTNNAEHIESWHRGWTLMCILVSRAAAAGRPAVGGATGSEAQINVFDRADIAIFAHCFFFFFFVCRWTPSLLCLIF